MELPRAARDGRAALKALVEHEPERHPLVIAFASPLGTRLDQIVDEVTAGLLRFSYDTQPITLSEFLVGVPGAPWIPLPERREANYHTARMDAGDKLRKDTSSDSILAAYAIMRIAELRPKCRAETAYVLRSLKHPDEVELLRHIYGDAFWLVGVVSGPDDREDDFADELVKAGFTLTDARVKARELIERDENDQSEPHGQHVGEVFAKADVFIPSRRGHSAGKDIERFLDGIFGRPFFTPYPTEEAMKFANGSSLRSASMGRQVGAVLLPANGSVYVTGTNEVPKPGGGQYWSGDEPDHRDFQLGSDPNPSYVATMLQELFERLARSDLVDSKWQGKPGSALLEAARQKDGEGISLLTGTRAEAVIEFTRCLHAEQAAIVNSARLGISTQNALLVTTTFPCHECAKFIVGAGIRCVIFIEPYPKSLVRQLYRDLIDARPPLPVGERFTYESAAGRKVPFTAFVGFAPQRYDDVFLAGVRREGRSSAVKFVHSVACPRGGGWSSQTVTMREQVAVAAVNAIVATLYESASNAPQRSTTSAKAVQQDANDNSLRKRGSTARSSKSREEPTLDEPRLAEGGE